MLKISISINVKRSEGILKHGRSFEIEKNCMEIKEILNLIPGTR